MNQVNVQGIQVRKDGKFYAHIKRDGKLLNLGVYTDMEEAQWARWYAERKVFGEFAREATEPEILSCRKEQITQYVDRKVQRL